jgi:hypothetical protein
MSSLALQAGRGQATVEHVGMVALVALLLSAAALWLVREVRPGPHPPRFVDAAAQPLESAESWVGRQVDPLAGLQPWSMPRAGLGPIGRALRTGVGVVGVLGRGVPAFAHGAVDRLVEHLHEMLRNPVEATLETLRGAYWAGTNPDQLALRAVRDLRAYVEDLRRRGWEEAYLKLAHDAGGETLDLALTRGGAELRRLLLRRLLARLPDVPAPPESGPGSP